MNHAFRMAIFVTLLSARALAESNLLTGNWVTPDHAVVTVYMCGEKTLCTKLIQVTNLAGRDDKNSDRSLRNRLLCGLELGKDFEVIDSSHACGGRIYDPDSGNTYDATMVSDGSQLKLRGYVGVSLFGRTEVWHRTEARVAVCTSS
jgi:uncharacterized protein (DUF2147 family)